MFSPTSHSAQLEWHTPQTARVKTLIFDANYSYRRVEEVTNIVKSTAWDLPHGSSSRRLLNQNDFKETQRVKKKMTREDVARCDEFFKKYEL